MIEQEKEISPVVLQEQFDSLLNHTHQQEVEKNLDNDTEAQNVHQVLEKMYFFQQALAQLNIDLKMMNEEINSEKNISCKSTFIISLAFLLSAYMVFTYHFSSDYKDAISYILLGLLPFLAVNSIISSGFMWLRKKMHFWNWEKRHGGQEMLDNYQSKKEELTQISQAREIFCKDTFNESFYFQCLFAYDEMVSHIETGYPAEYIQDIQARNLFNPAHDKEQMKKLYQSGQASLFLHHFVTVMAQENIISQDWRRHPLFHDRMLDEKYEQYAEKRKNELNRIL